MFNLIEMNNTLEKIISVKSIKQFWIYILWASRTGYRKAKHIKLIRRIIKNKWWVFCTVASLCTFIISCKSSINDPQYVLYLLSSISQGLSATFTLIFTITIFAAQLTMRFTTIDRIIDKQTKALMILFSVGIILPLLQLKTNLRPEALNTSDLEFISKTLGLTTISDFYLGIDICIATFCITSIIPYLMKVNVILKYDIGTAQLNEHISEAIESKNIHSLEGKIDELVSLGESSIENMLENKTIEIIGTLENIKDELNKETNTQMKSKISMNIFRGLEVIGLKSVDYGFDGIDSPKNPTKKAIDFLNILTVDFFNSNNIDKTQNVIKCLKNICLKSIDNNFNDNNISPFISFNTIKHLVVNSNFHESLMDSLIDNTIEIVNEASSRDNNKFYKTIEISAVLLWIIGASVYKNNSKKVEMVVDKIIGDKNDKFLEIFENEETLAKALKIREEQNLIMSTDIEGFKNSYYKFKNKD